MCERLLAFVSWVFGMPKRFWQWCCAKPDKGLAEQVDKLTEQVDESLREARVHAKQVQRKLRLNVRGDINNLAIAEAALERMAEVERRHE